MKFEDIKNLIKQQKICIIIPAYNCEKKIEDVISSILKYTSDIIIINDGSTDNTSGILSKFEKYVIVISYSNNKGKGYALNQGFIKAKELGFSYAISIDSDGQHSAEDIPSFVETISKNPDTLIVGARPFDHPNMPQGNIFANKFSNFWFTLQTTYKLPDTQTGYRLYPLKKMKKMRPFTSRYEAELELLVRSAWKGIKIISTPIQVHYDIQEEHISHFRPKKDFLRISLLNALFCFLAVLYGYPSMFIRKLANKS